ncbi:MAG: hypothetical protein GF313_07630 [Caldithrix sp.]|nr:hypothetical protein [Caldithrix sp.]
MNKRKKDSLKIAWLILVFTAILVMPSLSQTVVHHSFEPKLQHTYVIIIEPDTHKCPEASDSLTAKTLFQKIATIDVAHIYRFEGSDLAENEDIFSYFTAEEPCLKDIQFPLYNDSMLAFFHRKLKKHRMILRPVYWILHNKHRTNGIEAAVPGYAAIKTDSVMRRHHLQSKLIEDIDLDYIYLTIHAVSSNPFSVAENLIGQHYLHAFIQDKIIKSRALIEFSHPPIQNLCDITHPTFLPCICITMGRNIGTDILKKWPDIKRILINDINISALDKERQNVLSRIQVNAASDMEKVTLMAKLALQSGYLFTISELMDHIQTVDLIKLEQKLSKLFLDDLIDLYWVTGDSTRID